MAKKEKFVAREDETQHDDYRAYFDSNCLRVWHLQGKPRTFRVVKVTAFTSEIGNGNKREIRKQPKLMLETRGGEPISLPLLLNKTNAKTIAQLYGNKPALWAGKLITLYPTQTEMAGDTVDCIRVRNSVPNAAQNDLASRGRRAAGQSTPPPAPAPTEPDDEDEEPADPDDDSDDDTDEPPPGALETDHVQ
jgi:hypothetical protein